MATGLFALFVHWERSGCEHFVVFLLLGLLLAETTLYENQDLMPRSIFHPGSGTFDFRLPEVIITLALLARLAVRGVPRRVGLPALAWGAFAAWMLVALAEGILRHNSLIKLPYEAKSVIYVVGGYALASGVPIRRYLAGPGLERLVRIAAAAATLLILLSSAHKSFVIKIPGLPLPNFGVLGSDAAAVFVAIGVVGLVVELAKERRSAVTLLCGIPLFVAPFLAFQRAVLLMEGAAVTVVVLTALGATARRRWRLTLAPVLLAALAVVGTVLVVSVIPAIVGGGSPSIPLESNVVSTFESPVKAQSAQDRLTKWQVAWDDIREHPFIGRGMGFEYSYYVTGPNQFMETDITENLGLDLLLWAGLIGLVIFVLALAVSIVNGISTWRFHADPMVATLALGLLAVVVGIVTKGMVESVFEKYREATVLGLSLGMLRCAVTSRQQSWYPMTHDSVPTKV